MGRAKIRPVQSNSPGVNAAQMGSLFGPSVGMEAMSALTDLSHQVRDRSINRLQLEQKKTEEATQLAEANSYATARGAIDQRIADHRTFIDTAAPGEVQNLSREEFRDTEAKWSTSFFKNLGLREDDPRAINLQSHYYTQTESVFRSLDGKQDGYRDMEAGTNVSGDQSAFERNFPHTINDFTQGNITGEGLRDSIFGNLIEFNGANYSTGQPVLSDGDMLTTIAARTKDTYTGVVQHSLGQLSNHDLRLAYAERFTPGSTTSRRYPFISMEDGGIPTLNGVGEDIAPEEVFGSEADRRMESIFGQEFNRRNQLATFSNSGDPDPTIMEEAYITAQNIPANVVLPDNYVQIDRDTFKYQDINGQVAHGRVAGFDGIEGTEDMLTMGLIDLIATEEVDVYGRTIVEAFYTNPETGEKAPYGNFYIEKGEAHGTNHPLMDRGSTLAAGTPSLQRNPGTLVAGKPSRKDLVELVLMEKPENNPSVAPDYETFLQSQNGGKGVPPSEVMHKEYETWFNRINDLQQETAIRSLARSATPKEVDALEAIIGRKYGDSIHGRALKDNLIKARTELSQDIEREGVEHWIVTEPGLFEGMDEDTALVAASKLTNRVLGGGMEVRLPTKFLRQLETIDLGDPIATGTGYYEVFQGLRATFELGNKDILPFLFASLEKETGVSGLRYLSDAPKSILNAKMSSDEWGGSQDEVNPAIIGFHRQISVAVADGISSVDHFVDEVSDYAGYLVSRHGVGPNEAVSQASSMMLGRDVDLIADFGGQPMWKSVLGAHDTGKTSFIASKKAQANYASTIQDSGGYNNAIRNFMSDPAVLEARTDMVNTTGVEKEALMQSTQPYIVETSEGKLMVRFFTKDGFGLSPLTLTVDERITPVELDFKDFVDYYDVDIAVDEFAHEPQPKRFLHPALRGR